jgi:hypothetical protein
MSHPDHASPTDQPQDVVESIVPMMPLVLPVAGAVLISCWLSLPSSWPEPLASPSGRTPPGAFGLFLDRAARKKAPDVPQRHVNPCIRLCGFCM